MPEKHTGINVTSELVETLDDCQCCGLLEEDCSICWDHKPRRRVYRIYVKLEDRHSIVYISRRQLHRLFALCTPFDLILIGGRGLVMDYPEPIW